MLTSLFRKSTPLNYALLIIAVGVFFFLYQFAQVSSGEGLADFAQKLALLVVVYASFFIVNFIVKKNNISRDSAYAALFFLLFLLFFPSLLDNPNMLLSNLFILLALRRLISLHSPKASKRRFSMRRCGFSLHRCFIFGRFRTSDWYSSQSFSTCRATTGIGFCRSSHSSRLPRLFCFTLSCLMKP